MKNKKRLGAIALSSITLMSFTQLYFKMVEQVPIEIESREVELPQIKIEVAPIIINQQEMFLHALGMRESSNNYTVVNKWGYMGKYQFGKRTLKNLGYDVSRKEFLNSPYLQEQAMLDLLEHNKRILHSYIDIYEGTIVNGVKITESGILAAAHLGGPGNVKRYFKKGKQFKDGNGTKLTSYLTRFSGYNLNLN
jgi:hypothetical protein|tara:strand:- start:545 stop:1126 length:582 start_codon:yes stop_codon:yes gene_type:complete